MLKLQLLVKTTFTTLGMLFIVIVALLITAPIVDKHDPSPWLLIPLLAWVAFLLLWKLTSYIMRDIKSYREKAKQCP